jgi:hypothetical protein
LSVGFLLPARAVDDTLGPANSLAGLVKASLGLLFLFQGSKTLGELSHLGPENKTPPSGCVVAAVGAEAAVYLSWLVAS